MLKGWAYARCKEAKDISRKQQVEAARRNAERFARLLRRTRRSEPGPFDIIGDVHGCFAELLELLQRLGYVSDGTKRAAAANGDVPVDAAELPAAYRVLPVSHPQGRVAVFLGDIADRGPDSMSTIVLVSEMVAAGTALYVPGNHCRKLYRYFNGRRVAMKYGIEETVAQLAALPAGVGRRVKRKFCRLYEQATPYMILDEGRLVVAHAGIRADMIGRMSRGVESFCLFGDTTGERTEDGLPVRRDWAREYRGRALIVYGHTPVREAVLRYNTINIDTGCVFGGRLTAFRYPEKQLLDVEARTVHAAGGVFRELH